VNFLIPFFLKRIEADVHPVEPCLPKGSRHPGQPLSIRRNTEIPDTCTLDARYEGNDVITKERFTAGQTRLSDAVFACHAHDPYDLIAGQDIRPGEVLETRFRHAIDAFQVAPVGYGYSEIVYLARMLCQTQCTSR
jgi:hypothetical protein